MLVIMLPIIAAAAALVASSAAFAAGSPGVPNADNVATSATWIAISDVCLAACNAPATAAGMPRQAGSIPMNTFGLPGPGPRTGGAGWMTLSVKRAAGFPGIMTSYSHQFRRIMAPCTVTCAVAFRSKLCIACTVMPARDVISIPLASMVNFPIADLIVMSASASMVMLFAAVLTTILFFPLLSIISMVSLPAASFSRTTWPLQNLMVRWLFSPLSLDSGGVSLPFQRPPNT